MNEAARQLNAALNREAGIEEIAALLQQGVHKRAEYGLYDQRPIETVERVYKNDLWMLLIDAGLTEQAPTRDPLLFYATWSPVVTARLLEMGHSARDVGLDGSNLIQACTSKVGDDGTTLRLLAQHGAHIEGGACPEGLWQTPLGRAIVMAGIVNSGYGCFQALIELGANVERRDAGENTYLHVLQGASMPMSAQRAGQIVTALCGQGLDINAVNVDGETALHNAAHRGFKNHVAALLAAGADLSITNKMGFTAADKAQMENRHEVCDLLKAHEARTAMNNLLATIMPRTAP